MRYHGWTLRMVDTHDPLSSPSSASENEHAHAMSLIPGQQCVAAGLIVLESQSSGHDFRGVSLCPGIIIWGQKSRDKFACREMNFCRHPAPSWLYQRAWHRCSAQQAACISISAKSFGSTQMLQRSLSALRLLDLDAEACNVKYRCPEAGSSPLNPKP